jgi:hypothetical protein
MLYRPVDGTVVDRTFSPPMASFLDAKIFRAASEAAIEPWREVSEHPLISRGFRSIARANRATVEERAELVDLLPK